jgi:putative flavoprotein involved in K+ transport
MAGRDVGHIPFRIEGFWARLILLNLVLRILFHRVFTIDTKIGRKMREKALHIGGPLIRVKPVDLDAAGVKRLPKVVGTKDGLPLLEDGRTVDARNVIWSTGYQPAFSWIDLPIFDEHGEPDHHAGVVARAPGLYFVGLHYLYSLSSGMVQGMPRDAERIVRAALARRDVIAAETESAVGTERLAVGMS